MNQINITGNPKINNLGNYFPSNFVATEDQALSAENQPPSHELAAADEFGLPSEIDTEKTAEIVTLDISRVLKVSTAEAQSFIDRSTFDEIVDTLKAGDCESGKLNRAFLAMVFCHITMRNI